jgi:tetratricopeptide (TPR) repeat protein
VPGFEIPARYFQFLRSGDARPLGAVLEHNRLDLLTLAGLTVRLLQLVADGPGEARDAREALALGRVYQRAGLEARAVEAFECAMAMSDVMGDAPAAPIRIDALRSLALAARRARRYHDAAARWRQLLDIDLCPRHTAREALEALAIHHEHRVRDLRTARTFAVGSLDAAARTSASDRARHRLARLERKLSDDRGGATIPFQS